MDESNPKIAIIYLMKTTTNTTSTVLSRLFGATLVLVAVASFGVFPSAAFADTGCGSVWSASAGDYVSTCAETTTLYNPVRPVTDTSANYYIPSTSDYDYDYSYDNSINDSYNSYTGGDTNLGLSFAWVNSESNNYGYSSPNYNYNSYRPYSYGDYNPTRVTYIYDNHDYNYDDYRSPKPVPTCNINANDTSVDDGDSVTLNWSSNNATSGSITNLGSVGTSGSRSVQINGDTTYVYSVTGQGGNSSCSVHINVDDDREDAAPSCDLTASDTNISEGDSTTLRWYVTGNTESASINEGVGSVDEDGGTERVSPDEDTTYRLTVRGEGGSRTCSVTVHVDPDDQTNVSLNVTPTTPGNQPYTSVYLADAPYTGAGDMTTIIGSIIALVAAALIGGYVLFMKGLPFAFKRAAVNSAPVVVATAKKTQAKAIRVGGLDQNEVYGFMSAYALNDTQAMQAIRADIKARGITEDRLASRVSSAATDALTARKFGGATENALLTIDEATLTALAA